jgi:hypothetical protein
MRMRQNLTVVLNVESLVFLNSIICKERTAWLDAAKLMEQKELCPDLVWQAAVQFHEWAQMWTACIRLLTNERIDNMKAKKGIAVTLWNESAYQ